VVLSIHNTNPLITWLVSPQCT